MFGLPVALLMHSAGNPVHAWVRRMLRSRTVAAVTWPVATTAAHVVVVAGTHTPPVMDLVVRDGLAHAPGHVLYLVAGYLFFLPIVEGGVGWWRVSMPARSG